MDFGIAVATTTDSWRVVKRAEELGFKYAWFYDTQLLNPDVFIGMTQAAMHTSRIQLGTGVLIPSNRIEPVAANALVSLNKIAPGRIHFGVGTGFTGRRTMGLRALTLAQMENYTNRVMQLTRGETITWNFEDKERDIAFLDPASDIWNTQDPIALHVSALGPKARRAAAKLGGGWINFGADEAGALRTLQDMQEAWSQAKRTPADLYSTLFTLGCVLQPGETADSERAIAQAGPYVSVFFHNLVETTEPGSMESVVGQALSDKLEQYREVYHHYPEKQRYLRNHKGHLMAVRDDERFLIDADLVSQLTFTGTKEALRARVDALSSAGYNQLTIQLVEGQLDAIEDWADCLGVSA